jgi:hypothetical protein
LAKVQEEPLEALPQRMQGWSISGEAFHPHYWQGDCSKLVMAFTFWKVGGTRLLVSSWHESYIQVICWPHSLALHMVTWEVQ